MQYLACQGGDITTAFTGAPNCSGEWVASSAQLSIQGAAEIGAAILFICAIAWIFKQSLKSMGISK